MLAVVVRGLSKHQSAFLFDCCVFIARFALLSCYSSAKTRIRPVKLYQINGAQLNPTQHLMQPDCGKHSSRKNENSGTSEHPLQRHHRLPCIESLLGLVESCWWNLALCNHHLHHLTLCSLPVECL